MRWSFLNTGFNSGKFNMDFDAALVQQLQAGEAQPTLRVYRWNPQAISIGYHQSENDFDAGKLRTSGIDIVQRPTGGQAIYHAHELTYSVVTFLENKNLRTLYHEINEALLRGVQLLGINAELVSTVVPMTEISRRNVPIPCFAKSAKSEIQFRGKKLIGSAQRRYGDVVLQQGSFLLGPEHRQLVEFLNVDTAHESMKVLDSHATDAETILGRSVSFDEAQECVKQGFEQVLGVMFTEQPLHEPQML